nr:hypothetical protein [Tanacetum cinerariifolium]
MNYLEEQTDGEAMINSIKNGDQPLPRVTQVSIAGTSSNEQPLLKDKSMCNKTTKYLWDALARHMLGSKYGEQDKKVAVLKFYSKPTNNNLRTSSTSRSANKKQEFVKSDDNKVEKKNDEKKRDMSKVKCYNCKKERHFAKDCKKVKIKDYEYYKTKMLLAKKDKDEQVLLAEDQAWMESSNSEASSSSADDKISKEIINPDFDKIDSPFQQTSSLKPYVPTVILEKIIIDLEDEVVSLLEKEKENLKTIESLKSKNVETGVESSEKIVTERENQSENDCQVVEKNVTTWRIQRICDLFNENNLFIFDDESVRISTISKMPFRKKPRDSLNVRSKHCPDLSLDHRFRMFKAYDG